MNSDILSLIQCVTRLSATIPEWQLLRHSRPRQFSMTVAEVEPSPKRENNQASTVQLFDFKGAEVRLVEIEGNPWFAAADVCDVLEIASVSYAYRRLDDSEKSNVGRTHLGMNPGKPMTAISEFGLYKLALRSDKPEAKSFQDWVTKVVLPAIRKDGAHVNDEGESYESSQFSYRDSRQTH